MVQLNRAPISVVIPCYKHVGVLGRAIDSVVNQSTLPLEIIVVIDGPSEDLDQFLRVATLILSY